MVKKKDPQNLRFTVFAVLRRQFRPVVHQIVRAFCLAGVACPSGWSLRLHPGRGSHHSAFCVPEGDCVRQLAAREQNHAAFVVPKLVCFSACVLEAHSRGGV